MGGKRCGGDEIVHRGTELNHLCGLGKTDQNRTDHRAAADLLDQLGRDVGAVQARHDQHIGSPRQAAEGIDLLHQIRIQSDVGLHLAVVLEIDPARVQHRYRIADALRLLAHGIAESWR